MPILTRNRYGYSRPGDDEDDISEPIEQLDIAPELMAEWEEKLRLAEEAEREGEAEAVEEELIEPIGYRGVRQRRAHVSHVQRRG